MFGARAVGIPADQPRMERDAVDQVAQGQCGLARVVDLQFAAFAGVPQALFQRRVDLLVHGLLQGGRQLRHPVAFRHQQAVQGGRLGLDGIGQEAHGKIVQGGPYRLAGRRRQEYGGPQIVQFRLQHGRQHALFVAEQLISGRGGSPGLLHDALDGGLRVALFQQGLAGRFKQPPPAGFALARQRARRRIGLIAHHLFLPVSNPCFQTNLPDFWHVM
ncbi:hypothetical protein D3C72_1495520 [compost metagenome]